MPKAFDQIAATTAEHEKIAGVRICGAPHIPTYVSGVDMWRRGPGAAEFRGDLELRRHIISLSSFRLRISLTCPAGERFMLDFYFKYPRVLRRLRDGALGNEMDRIAAHFSELGYNPASAKIYIGRLGRFSEFAARDAGTARIDQNVIDRFLLSLQTGSPRVGARTAIGHARRVAPERFSAPCRQAAADPDGPLLAAYLDHLLRVRGLEPKTCEGLLTVRPPDSRYGFETICLISLSLR